MKSELPSEITCSGYLRLPQILQLIPIGRSTWWHWVSTGKAPQSIKLGPRTTVWRAEDINQFILELEKQGGDDE
ncbi:MAG: AlpA family phage regulatory protein [Gammaproteobacteria bacterium]